MLFIYLHVLPCRLQGASTWGSRPQELFVLFRDGQANGENIDLFGISGQGHFSGVAGTAGAAGTTGGRWTKKWELRAEPGNHVRMKGPLINSNHLCSSSPAIPNRSYYSDGIDQTVGNPFTIIVNEETEKVGIWAGE